MRSWLVIPAVAVGCLGLALALDRGVPGAFAVGALGAALAAAVRGFSGSSAASTVAAAAAALLGVACVLEVPGVPLVRAALAGAAAVFAIAELARPTPASASPMPALGAGVLAAVLDPSYVALIALVGVRYATGPWTRPRWAIAVPIVGLVAIALAAGRALWPVWAGRAMHGAGAAEVAAGAGDAFGPLVVVAALGGLVVCMTRGRFAAGAVVAVGVGAVLVDLRAGALGPATAIAVALTAGVGLGRLAAMVRWPAAQACLAACAGFVMLVAPALQLHVGSR